MSDRPFRRPTTTAHARYVVRLGVPADTLADHGDALADRLRAATVSRRDNTADPDPVPAESVTVDADDGTVTVTLAPGGTLEHPVTEYGRALSHAATEWYRTHGPVVADTAPDGVTGVGTLTADVLDVDGAPAPREATDGTHYGYLLARPERPLTGDEQAVLEATLADVDTGLTEPTPEAVAATPTHVRLLVSLSLADGFGTADAMLRRVLADADLRPDRVGEAIADAEFWTNREAGTLAALDDTHREAVRERAAQLHGDAFPEDTADADGDATAEVSE